MNSRMLKGFSIVHTNKYSPCKFTSQVQILNILNIQNLDLLSEFVFVFLFFFSNNFHVKHKKPCTFY